MMNGGHGIREKSLDILKDVDFRHGSSSLPVDDNAVSDLQERFRGTMLHLKDSEHGGAEMIWNATTDGDSRSSPSV